MRSDVVCGLSWFGEKLHFKTIAYSRMKFFMSTIGVSDVEHWGAPVSDLFELSSFQNSPRKKLLTSGSSNSIDLYDPKRVSRAVRARLSLYKLLSPSSAAETVEILSAEISAGGYLSVTDPSADAVSEDGEVAAACIRIFELRDKFEATWEIWRVDADHPKEIGKLVFGKVDQSYDASIRGQYLLLMPHDQDRTVLYDLRTLKPVGSVPGRPAGK